MMKIASDSRRLRWVEAAAVTTDLTLSPWAISNPIEPEIASIPWHDAISDGAVITTSPEIAQDGKAAGGRTLVTGAGAAQAPAPSFQARPIGRLAQFPRNLE
jgi:hypothetical protein